ncbi:WD repeat protein Lub1 [Elasticomyces elasticus]|nr:WD repeat protein Lub1 [Elasticomyces elasticus]KAK4997468.1 WD repeat protein Lub1 [Elasticomyces elasticus]
MGDFKLSASLAGHEDDWSLKASKPPLYDDTIATQSSSFINSLTYSPPSPDHPDGLVISGGKDTIIEVRQPGKSPDHNAERLLIGHANNVCALDVSSDGRTVVSGGWDAQARVWDISTGECTAQLDGHGGSVWSVLAYDKETVITGCADKLIRIFSPRGKLLRTIKGSSDVVRALCRLPPNNPRGASFASAGNDQIIRLWTLEGDELGQLHGHENFVYSLATLPNGDLVSSSEDRTVRIWRDGECIQTITHPAISVWSVAVCPGTGDIVSGASDKIVRVFTRDQERLADPDSLKAFDDSVKASSIPQQSVSNEQINKEKLPGPEFIQEKSGTKEGQVQMIRESNGNVSAYQWSSSAQQWFNVGTVVDSSASSGRKLTHNGKDYDYVFDVDIEDGKPPLKLPYNLSQNPYEAAQKFITDNELPITYLDQVANFIVTNTQGATLSSGGGQQTQAPGADPWGSENRYRPGEVGAPEPQAPSRPRTLPQTTYLSITSANVTQIRKKLLEFNDVLVSDGSKDLSMNPEDVSNLDALLKQISTTPENPNPQPAGVDLVRKITTQWPADKRMPGLDLLRLLAVSPALIEHTSAGQGTIVDVLVSADAFNLQDLRLNNTLMAIRTLANMFVTESGRLVADGCFDQILSLVSPFLQHVGNNKNLPTALGTLYINIAVMLRSGPSTGTPTKIKRAAVLSNDLIKLLNRTEDSEAVYRGLVALGTLLSMGDEVRSEMDAKAVGTALGKVAKSALGKEARMKNVLGDIRDEME